ncbi:hypothetical protein, partial [Solemya velum gill symbiont]|uniref:hypothetical protein n=1 Tax=Solemya velum gill symbiont TaxID=2340 RepID=UPI001183AB9C
MVPTSFGGLLPITPGENFITNNNLCLFNDKSPTFLHSGHGTFSSIDLSISNPSLFLEFEWSVENDLHGSDHFPLILKNTETANTAHPPKWKMSKANWTQFESMCLEKLTTIPISSTAIEDYTSILLTIADDSIPKTSGKSIARRNPWFNDDCKKAIAKRKRNLRHFQQEPTSSNLGAFKISRAQARRTIRQTRKNSWRDYVSRLNNRTSPKSVWRTIRSMNGKGGGSKSAPSHLSQQDTTITDTLHIANALGDKFSQNSSSSNCSDTFSAHRAKLEQHSLNFKSSNFEDYNTVFSLNELQISLSKSHNSAPGPDGIHYELLKHLPSQSLDLLLDIFNYIWTSGSLPSSWKEATVIPIAKPGKD